MSIQASGFHSNKEITTNTNSNVIFLKSGVTQVRVLPAYSETGAWFREIQEIPLHDANGKFSPIVSPASVGDPCPFMQEGRRLYDLKGEENIDRAKKFKPNRQFLFNVVVQVLPEDAVNIVNCVKVLKCGIKVAKQIFDLDQDHSGGWGDITNLEAGFDIRITRSGKGLTTEYSVRGVPGRTNVTDWLETNGFNDTLAPHNLDAMYMPPSQEEIMRRFDQFVTQLYGPVPVGSVPDLTAATGSIETPNIPGNIA